MRMETEEYVETKYNEVDEMMSEQVNMCNETCTIIARLNDVIDAKVNIINGTVSDKDMKVISEYCNRSLLNQ